MCHTFQTAGVECENSFGGKSGLRTIAFPIIEMGFGPLCTHINSSRIQSWLYELSFLAIS